MGRLQRRQLWVISCLLVPFLTLCSPDWLALSGVAPCWAVLWLLPWAIEDGPLSGALLGLCLGLLMDSITFGNPSHLPSLILLGFWWGRIGLKIPSIERSLSLGLLALIGTFLFGISIWIQILISEYSNNIDFFSLWSFKSLLSQSVLTGLLAPVFSSWLLIFWRKCLKY